MNPITKKVFLVAFSAILSLISVSAQQRSISGTITDGSDGSTLVGASIVVKGTTNGTVTDAEGQYTIEAASDDVLLFSFIGYSSQEIVVGSQTVINASLDLSYSELDELVVVGYGYTKKSDLTGAISSISSDAIASRPSSRIDYALQGQAAGVQVSATSGMPGSGPSIRIRGHGSLQTTNSPLWVIDGFIGGDINSVAPEDVESIEILKDASSTAIYGARGGNGVILVTTKRGSKDQSRIDFSYYHQISNVSKKMDLLNRAEYTTLRNQALTNVGLSPLFTQGQIDNTEPIDGYYADTDWQDEIYRTAHANYYNLSFSGGNEKTSFALSANFREEDGVIYDSDFTRGGVRINLDHEFSKKLRIGMNANVFRTEGNSFDVTTSWSLGAAGGALTAFPYYPLYDSQGEYYNLSTWDNPRLAAEGQKDNRITTGLTGNFFLVYEPIKGLSLKADMAGSYSAYQQHTFVTADLFGATATRGLAQASITDNNYNRWTGSFTATYDKTFAADHHIKALVGLEQQVAESTYNNMFSEDIGRESFLWYNMAAFAQVNHSINSGISGSVFQSVFGRVDYNFLNRYVFEATIRRDGSSKFGPEEKWGTFPSASAAWKLSEENFIKNLGIFDQFKLRVSWGVSGNDNIALYQWLPRMAVGTNRSNYLFGSVGAPSGDVMMVGASIGQIPNESVHWEESATTNIGLDLGFLNNRLRFNLDLYTRTTSELLWNYPLPVYTGYGDGWSGGVNVISNIAEMNNKGLEIAIGGDIFARGNFTWSISGNLSMNKNMVVSLAEDSEFYSGITKIEPGKPIGNMWGFITDGIFQPGDDVDNTPRFSGDEGIGDQRYLDANGNGVLTNEDMGMIGSALPDFIYGLVNTCSYKNFELYVMLNGVQGVDMYNGTRQGLSNGALGETNGGKWLLESWTPENTDTDITQDV